MCCTYVLVKEVVLQEIVWRKKLPIKDVSLGAFIGVFLHFFFRNSSSRSSTNYFSLMVPKGVFRDFSHSGIKTEKNSAKNVICHIYKY